MPVILVLQAGPLTTVQDLGRPGYGSLGVSAAGAADPIALRAGNRLLGNPPNAPAIEMTLIGGSFRFPDGATVAITGAVFDCSLPLWATCRLAHGATIRIGPTQSGARCYLCVRGGIEAARFLGSASTHVRSGLGPRPLAAGDMLEIGQQPAAVSRARVRRAALERLAPRKLLRVTAGPHLDPGALLAFGYEVTEASDRMGIRLRGEPLKGGGVMTTEGVSLGAIQVPAGGQPMIVFVDAQTTGGYPIAANVVAADLPSLGQLRPRDEVRFAAVSLENARELYLEQERLLRSDELLW